MTQQPTIEAGNDLPSPRRIGVVYIRPRPLVYVRATGPYRDASRRAWDKLRDWLHRTRSAGQVTCGYGLAHDDLETIEPALCRYDACVEPPEGVSLALAEIGSRMLPGGSYARSRHTGTVDTMKATIVRMRDEWLPTQPQLVLDRQRPFLFIYLTAPIRPADRSSASDLRIDVCLPVEAVRDQDLSKLPI